jgi:hypothetical protein
MGHPAADHLPVKQKGAGFKPSPLALRIGDYRLPEGLILL